MKLRFPASIFPGGTHLGQSLPIITGQVEKRLLRVFMPS